MSNIYIQEPPTNGKVLLKTTVGDIDIELWSKETPKAARNFVQLCLEGYYDGTAFHRVVKEFIVQGGDPTDSGDGGESVYGAPFKDEFHQRLRFVRRGLVAMANAGQHDNGSQFFFTMAATPELQNKHTIFGKVVGDTLFNMLKLQEVEVNEVTEKPVEPHRILTTEVLNNPFEDIVPRQIKRVKKDKEDEKKIKSKSKATKNFSLLSFGDEAEDDEEQVDKATESFRGKSKSSHDLTDDPRLSSIPAVEKDLNAEEDKRKKKPDGTPEDKAKKSPDAEDRETKTKPEGAEDEAKKKAEAAEEPKKGKTEAKEEEKKKKKQPDTPERPEKKKSPAAAAEEDSPKKKMMTTEGEEEARKTAPKEEAKEEPKPKKKPEAEGSPPESRKRKVEDGHREERKKRSKEREDEERGKKRKADGKEEEGRKKRKGEEGERKKTTTEEEKGDVKKKAKIEPAETSTQPSPEEKVVKEEGEARKVKKEKEDAPSRGKEQEGRSLLGSLEESKQQRMEELKKEQRKLQRDIKDFKKRTHDKVKVKAEEPEEEAEEKGEEEVEDNDLLAMVKKERQKYKLKKRELGHRDNREAATLAMLAKFQTRLANARTLAGDYDDDDDVDEEDDEEKHAEGEEEEEDPADMSWMRHKLHFEDRAARSRVIDANVQDDDRYAISDPRNPLTQRRRQTSKKSQRDKR